MKLSSTLQSEIIDFLLTLPNIQDATHRQAFIERAGLDSELQGQIQFVGSPTQFFQLLVPLLVRYSKLNSGEYALEAVLASAKHYIGQDRKKECDVLLEKVHNFRRENECAKIESNPYERSFTGTLVKYFKSMNSHLKTLLISTERETNHEKSSAASGGASSGSLSQRLDALGFAAVFFLLAVVIIVFLVRLKDNPRFGEKGLSPELVISGPQFRLEHEDTWRFEFPNDLQHQFYTVLFATIGYESLNEMNLAVPNAMDVIDAKAEELSRQLETTAIRYPIRVMITNKGDTGTIVTSIRLKVSISNATQEVSFSDLNLSIPQGETEKVEQLTFVELSSEIAESINWRYVLSYFDKATDRILKISEQQETVEMLEAFLIPPKDMAGGVSLVGNLLGMNDLSFSLESIEHTGRTTTTKRKVIIVE